MATPVGPQPLTPAPVPRAETGASFATGAVTPAPHVAPASANNYGAKRYTSWGTSQFQGASLSAANLGSFVNFEGQGNTFANNPFANKGDGG
jgi:hypothetical protein